MKLDRSRDFGTCYGDPRVAYMQDGKFFGPDERELPDEIAQKVAAPSHGDKVRAGIARKKAQQPTAA